MIIVIWSSGLFLRYIKRQFIKISKGVITIMVRNRALYKISEAEIFNYGIKKTKKQNHSLNPKIGNSKSITYTLFLQ